MNASEIRSRFLSYFEGHGHRRLPSSSLLPENDPSLFFVNAGMVPFKEIFTGAQPRKVARATSSQKCLRVSGKHNDLENVGRTPRHHTFFEMLGNFSFGDYFKAEAIEMAWRFLVDEMKLNPERLWVTVYKDDEETYDLWVKLGFPTARIQRLGAKDNFWSMGDTGPCGPCTEIHYDHGPTVSDETGGPATEDDRYVEIWNLVFMQYNQAADGSRSPLPSPSIDTGMGLERLAAIKQGVYSNYDTDLFQPLIQQIASEAGVRYNADDQTDVSLRVIADHSRATAFLIGDGVMPSNEGRGYVLRRIMRRAIRFGVKMDLNEPFLYKCVAQVIESFGPAHPELMQRADFIREVVLTEEQRFARTLDRGMRLLQTELESVGQGGVISGPVAFTLSDTYGFPLDLTELIAAESSVKVDRVAYQQEMEAQRARGRAAWKGSGAEAVTGLWQHLAETHGPTTFSGYDRYLDKATVIAVCRTEADGESGPVERLEIGQKGIILLDKTPFYGESGGQAGDTGQIDREGSLFKVVNTLKAAGLFLHHGELQSGSIGVGDSVSLHVHGSLRDQTRRNHTGTHLLHAALRDLVGDHITQKGSLVAPSRLRFDFAHHKALTSDEMSQVEARVNAQIRANVPVNTEEKDIAAAKADGAMALFGEKYGDLVRVVSIPGFSVELCGGTHVRATGDIGLFKIISEGGIAAGVRRIEALTGASALQWVNQQNDRLAQAANALKTSPSKLLSALLRLQEEKKTLQRSLDALKRDVAKAAADDLLSSIKEIKGVRILAAQFDGDLREQADRLRDQMGSGLVVLGSSSGDKVQLIAAATKDLKSKGVHAGELIKVLAPMIGGRGGGRPDMARAGGTNPGGLGDAIAHVYQWASDTL